MYKLTCSYLYLSKELLDEGAMKTFFLTATIIICLAFISCVELDKRLAGKVEAQERADISDTTLVIDMKQNVRESMKLSRLIKDVGYLELENVEGSFLYSPKNIKMVDSLLYILDIENQLKCFNLDGRFIRDAYVKGHGPEEVVKLYDFDVDSRFLYLLDGTASAILRFKHDGTFVDRRKLPFLATRLKSLSCGNYLFELAPFTLDSGKEDAQVVVTDSLFQIKNEYFEREDYNSVGMVTRTPYFENGTYSTYFAPIHRRGIYAFEKDGFYMKFYLDFGTPYYEPSNQVDGDQEAKSGGLFYTYENPFHTDRYLLQSFVTSVEMNGLFVLDLQSERSLFVRHIENDMEDVIDFDFRFTKFYDADKDLFVSTTDFYYIGTHAEDEIRKASEHLSDWVKKILIRPEQEEINPILMFYRLQTDIVE